jgi:RNA polymerase sigma-70 factor (ECF subfamily)
VTVRDAPRDRACRETRLRLDSVFRAESGRILATLISDLRDFELAEEALAEAAAAALAAWPERGVPAKPGAWLTTTARRKALDRVRRDRRLADKTAELTVLVERDLAAGGEEVSAVTPHLRDDRLRLIFTCCHPALALDTRVALTLRTLCGLSTAEVARALLVAEPAMAQRLVRAKRKIRDAGIPYRVPPPALLPERLPAVLAVVYLVFNEGYGATAGAALIRTELCTEALRLAALLVELMPGEREVLGLAALLHLTDARRPARTTSDGELVLLEDQDRSRWDRMAIEVGTRLLARALRLGPPGAYALQAAIAAEHARAATAAETDWRRIVALYADLAALQPGPVVELNRAVAVAMADGPEAGLALLQALDGRLPGYHLLPAARADLLRRAGRPAAAAEAYREALALARNDPEQRFLARRLAELRA